MRVEIYRVTELDSSSFLSGQSWSSYVRSVLLESQTSDYQLLDRPLSYEIFHSETNGRAASNNCEKKKKKNLQIVLLQRYFSLRAS